MLRLLKISADKLSVGAVDSPMNLEESQIVQQPCANHLSEKSVMNCSVYRSVQASKGDNTLIDKSAVSADPITLRSAHKLPVGIDTCANYY